VFAVLCVILVYIKDIDHPVKLRQQFEVLYYARVSKSLMMISEEEKISKQRREMHGYNVD